MDPTRLARIAAKLAVDPSNRPVAEEATQEGDPPEATEPDINAINQALYYRTDPFSENERGSQLFWTAFAELNMVDWTPITDPAEVFKKTREIAERFKAEGLQLDPAKLEQDARENWQIYRKHIMHRDVKKLNKLGLL